MRGELICLPDPIHPDHVAESARSAGGNPGQGVFEHRGAAGLNPEGVRGGEEHVWCWFARQLLPLRGQTIDALFEQVLNVRDHEHVTAVGTRRDHRPAQASIPHGPHIGDRPRIRMHPVAADPP